MRSNIITFRPTHPILQPWKAEHRQGSHHSLGGTRSLQVDKEISPTRSPGSPKQPARRAVDMKHHDVKKYAKDKAKLKEKVQELV